jgi:probable rRNA maturation factor
MKDAVLGPSYHLSLVIAGDKYAQGLNNAYRKKVYIPNVLSFPLDKMNGEIVLNLRQAKREHSSRGESYEYFVSLLFIHGMLHLKGERHGSTMEGREAHFLRRFRIVNSFVR